MGIESLYVMQGKLGEPNALQNSYRFDMWQQIWSDDPRTD